MAVDTTRLEEALRAMAFDLDDRLGAAFVDGAQGRCSRRSGTLADSIHVTDVSDSGNSVTAHVIVDAQSENGEYYGQYQDEGTGIYGPDGAPIVPTSARVLRFDWPAAGGIVFAHSVQGSPGTHFWSDTVADWTTIVQSV